MEGKAGCFHLCVVCNVSSSLSPTETGCDLNELDEDKVQLELWEILYNYVLGFGPNVCLAALVLCQFYVGVVSKKTFEFGCCD